jgi:hypothetical protein
MKSFGQLFVLAFIGFSSGYGRGPPSCTLSPHHNVAKPQKTNCLDFFTFTYRPDNSTDGQLVTIEGIKDNQIFKGTVSQIKCFILGCSGHNHLVDKQSFSS